MEHRLVEIAVGNAVEREHRLPLAPSRSSHTQALPRAAEYSHMDNNGMRAGDAVNVPAPTHRSDPMCGTEPSVARLTVRLTPSEPLCLRCSCVLDDDQIPYCHPLGVENGVEYRLCWDCAPIAWQGEV
jgi:hypothetical protein